MNILRRLFTPKTEKDTDDGQNPWAGLASYEDPATAERKLKFCGRDDDSYDVAKLIMGNTFVTLYGKSGIGKTSLLNAGVFPELREDQYSPLSLRLGIRDDKNIQSYQTVIIDAVNRAVSRIEEIDVIPVQEDQQSVDYLWKFFASHRFYDKDDNPTIPVVVFDQFEEVFRNNREEAETLLRQLDNCAVNGSSHRYEINIRFVVSIREDDLYRLEDSIDNCYLPALKRCRYRLRSLSEQGAKDAILIPGEGLFSNDEQEQIAQAIIGIARNKNNESISTNLLSLVCNRLYVESQKTSSSLISLSLVDSFVKTNFFERFYTEATRGFSSKEKSYIEEHLVDSTGRRNSIPESDFLTHVKNGERLLEGKNRILQRTSTSSDGKNYRIELIHDSFCEPLVELKKKREQRRKILSFFVGAAILLTGVCLIAYFIHLVKQNESKDKTIETTQESLHLSEAEKDSIQKQKDKVLELNEALIALNQVFEMQRDSLHELTLILSQKNRELEISNRQIREQQEEIQKKNGVIMGNLQMGLVKTKGRMHNGKLIEGKPLSDVAIKVSGMPNPVLSNSDGNFWLSIKHGDKFKIQSVRKKDYELINPEILSQEFISSEAPLVIVLDNKMEMEKDKEKTIQRATKYLQKKINALNEEISILKEENALLKEQLSTPNR